MVRAMDRNREQELIRAGLDNGILSLIDADNFPFTHILVPESVFSWWEGRADQKKNQYVSSFPDRFLPSDFQIPKSPIFGVHSQTGDIMTGAEGDADAMMEAKKVWGRKIGSRSENLRPLIEESQERYDMIGAAIKGCEELGLKYFYCLLELRVELPVGIVKNEIDIVVRGA